MFANDPCLDTKTPRIGQSTAVQQARPLDAETVPQISREAYRQPPPVLGLVPQPGVEDYRPHIKRGEVWILEAGNEPVGVIVLEEKPISCWYTVSP